MNRNSGVEFSTESVRKSSLCFLLDVLGAEVCMGGAGDLAGGSIIFRNVKETRGSGTLGS